MGKHRADVRIETGFTMLRSARRASHTGVNG